MAGYLDRGRASRLMQDAGFDALVLMQPETLRWATGSFPGVATLWRRAGAATLVVPCDPGQPLVAIVGDLQAEAFQAVSGITDIRTHPIWVDTAVLEQGEIAPARPVARPATFEAAMSGKALASALGPLANARVGLEFSFVPHADFKGIADSLPGASLADCSRLVERMRAFKTPEEIALLEIAGRAAEAGVRYLLDEITAGMPTAQLAAIWREAALDAAKRENAPGAVETWAYLSVGGDGFSPGGPLCAGDLIKIDVGCVVNGYSSDSGRTAVLGRASPMAQRVHDALAGAFEAAASLLVPGMSFSGIHGALHEVMRHHGFTGYSRGHVGHSCGASIFSEEWPFISANSEEAAEPGMVLALEAPWYIRGLGGFIIEDQFTITERGAEPLWRLPRGLIEIER